VRLVFVHGWALGPEIWDNVSPLLGRYPQLRVDLGFFGAPGLPEFLPGDILVGHSAGLLWGLRQRDDWAGAVAINSFSRFCLDAQGRGCVRPAALRAMQKSLAQDAEACVGNFRASIGAPPDPLGPLGQVWGLPPFCPHRARADGYRAAAELYAANMRHAGALRIDHVMGLARQFWVPDGADGADGAYVDFPLDDLLGQLALESARARCLVIGEDLGTVPHGLRETMAAQGLLSYRVLPFERDGAAFRPPDVYPRLAWACVATHDLPPLAGWWDGVDIDERLNLDLMGAAEAEAARAERAAARTELMAALADAGLVEAPADAEPGALTADLAAAIHAYVALTPSLLALAQAEDLAGEREAVNLPGTDTERPNWRRRVGRAVEGLFETAAAKAILAAMRAVRSG